MENTIPSSRHRSRDYGDDRMDQRESFQSQIQETMAQIYSRMAPETKREVDQQTSLPSQEQATEQRPGAPHRIPERHTTTESEANKRLFPVGSESWSDACRRFTIGKRYHNAHLNEVKKLYLWAYDEGMRWLSHKLKPSLYISGNAGSGKTYMALALLRGMIEQRIHKADIYYITSDDLDDKLLRAIEDRNESYVLDNFCEVPYLFIDDLGVEKQTERVIKQYYKIIDRRLNDYKTTVFTSNISKTKIEKNLGDRIASRLELCNEIKFPDRDLRKEI